VTIHSHHRAKKNFVVCGLKILLVEKERDFHKGREILTNGNGARKGKLKDTCKSHLNTGSKRFFGSSSVCHQICYLDLTRHQSYSPSSVAPDNNWGGGNDTPQ
jgi:hypothetical protein